MSSILLSFVGNQDPSSEQTNEEGSIVTLTRYLLEENNLISHVFLLYTQNNQEAAILTKEWLIGEVLNLKLCQENIILISVDNKLSQDPVDLLLAIQEAKEALQKVNIYLNKENFLELNASSGTPAMKSAWSILQAAGYAPKSRVWHVRNPRTKLPEQSRVFKANVDSLKREFDIKIIKEQIEKYNYNGALITFKASNLPDNGVTKLLRCGSYRLSSVFDASFQEIKQYSNIIDPELYNQSKNLAARQHREIIKEIYFQADIKAKNQDFSELLVKLFVFQEVVLFYLIKEKLLTPQDINLFDGENLRKKIKNSIEASENSKLKSYLSSYQLKNNQKIDLNRELNRVIMMAIIDFFYDDNMEIYKNLKELNEFCQQRNEYIHQFKGVNKLESEEILKKMKKIIKSTGLKIQPNPYQIINQQIMSLIMS